MLKKYDVAHEAAHDASMISGVYCDSDLHKLHAQLQEKRWGLAEINATLEARLENIREELQDEFGP